MIPRGRRRWPGRHGAGMTRLGSCSEVRRSERNLIVLERKKRRSSTTQECTRVPGRFYRRVAIIRGPICLTFVFTSCSLLIFASQRCFGFEGPERLNLKIPAIGRDRASQAIGLIAQAYFLAVLPQQKVCAG